VKEKQQLERLYNLYVTNRCTAEELELFLSLVNTSDDDTAILELLSKTWDQTYAIPDTDLVPDFLPQPAKPLKMHTNFSGFRWLITTAAAVLLILGGLYFLRSDFSESGKANTEQITVTKAERRQIQLADGTKVWLSPNSKLNFPAKFKDSYRIVSLEGEAFFEVAHDASHPFIIKTGKVSTTVLGTSFNISAYTQQHTINVTLVTGKVAVALEANSNTRSLIMLPNQQITVDKTTNQLSKVDFPGAASFLDKRLGLYEYKGAALREVIEDIEMQYAIQIHVSEELSDDSFYGNLNMADPIEQTLNKLSTVMEIKWTRNGGQYVIAK
jgi:transmembrane sensor